MSTGSAIARDAVAAALTAGGASPATHSATRPAMGGHASITLVGGNRALLARCFGLLDECEARWSRFSPDSDISRLNHAEGATVRVDTLTRRLIDAMLAGHAVTGGDFDPTLLPALLAEGYAASAVDPTRRTTLPASATAPGNPSGIRLEGDLVTMPLGTTLDSGGVGKGLAADLIVQAALDEGAWGAMAQIGGDVAVAGQSPDGRAWRLGVEDPFEPGRHSAVVRMRRGAVVTSSQRKRRWSGPEGERHHLIDPRTRASAASDIQTVTVIAASGSRAEALTKPGFLREPGAYLDWLPTIGAAGLLIDTAGALRASENWARYL